MLALLSPFFAPLLAALPLQKLKLYAIGGVIVFALGALGACQVESWVEDWQARRANVAALRDLTKQANDKHAEAAAQANLARQRAIAYEKLAEDHRELSRGLAHVNEPLVIAVPAKAAAAGSAAECNLRVSADRLRLLRAALERGDRGGDAATAAAR